ncbi:hypothetical protein ACJX0J_018702, partial [Zea mays]
FDLYFNLISGFITDSLIIVKVEASSLAFRTFQWYLFEGISACLFNKWSGLFESQIL